MKSSFRKNTQKPVQKYRFLIQTLFALLCIWIGIEFYMFVNYLESGGGVFYERPPGVEGFLPISALMSVYYFILSGELHSAHPAGFFILIAIIGTSLFVGKSFCSWMCPVGFLSELVGDFGEKMFFKPFKKKPKLPKLLDYPLRSLKYLLLGFFVYAIFFSMTELSLKYFLDGAYNKLADVKMYYFFADISRFSLIVIAALFVLSIFVRNFWCRYLCPYGALLGLLSFLSPNKIKRNKQSCIDCGLCTKACPSFIKVDKVSTVISDECTSCMSCVDVCPAAHTLEFKSQISGKRTSKIKLALGIVLIFISVIGFAKLSGNWQNNISKEEYLIHFKNIDNIGHPTSTAEIEELNKTTEKKNDELGQAIKDEFNR